MRRLAIAGVMVTLLGLGAGPATAPAQTVDPDQAAMMQAWIDSMTPGPEHAGLATRVGTWTVSSTMWPSPGADPMVSHGTAERVMINDGRALEETFTGEMEGQTFHGRATTGYDNVTEQYWSTWIDTMSTSIAVFYGDYDEGKGAWVMEGETADPMTGDMIDMRIEIREDGPDREIEDFYMPGPDGELFKTMELVYERQ
ncbi:MAG: DUF1579 family protein [Rhodospirillaceae bacterium]|nr:DUF1579 family protein [Rhodospirillaceae bacterium]